MTPLTAFFWGIFITLFIVIVFWFLATINTSVNTTYRNTFCYGVCGYDGTGGLGGPA
jgi:hypothetical protein